MENWGLVTFRESAVLFDPGTGSIADKKLVTMIVDHELAHQVKVQKKCFVIVKLERAQRGVLFRKALNLCADVFYFL